MRRPHDFTDSHTGLLLRAQRGDCEAFAELYTALRPVVMDFVTSMDGSFCPHERQDVVQEVFLRIWQNLQGYRQDASARTFVLAIARKVALKNISGRKNSRVIQMADPPDLAEGSGPPGRAELLYDPDEAAGALRQAMARLTEVQRQAVELDQIHELPRAEALRFARCTEVAFADRLHRGMKALRRILGRKWGRSTSCNRDQE